jgi:HSF-type DNA-binding
MLKKVEENNQEDIVSWINDGKAFRVHDPKKFAEKIMPQWFNQTKFRSFQRQLHIYGFDRIRDRSLSEDGAYFHQLFVKGQEDICTGMTRKKIKGTGMSNAERQALAAARVTSKTQQQIIRRRDVSTATFRNHASNFTSSYFAFDPSGSRSNKQHKDGQQHQMSFFRQQDPCDFPVDPTTSRFMSRRRVSMSEEEWAERTMALVESITANIDNEDSSSGGGEFFMNDMGVHHYQQQQLLQKQEQEREEEQYYDDSPLTQERDMNIYTQHRTNRRGSLLHDGDEVTFGNKKFHFTSSF